MNIALILQDGILAAVAAIGFLSISRPETRVYPWCAVAAGLGHMTRYVLMNDFGILLPPAAMAGALVIGAASLIMSVKIKTPAECISFPALLPMIPGMYAYRSIQSLIQCLCNRDETIFMHYLYTLKYNWITCMTTIAAMVIGVMIPILLFQKFLFKVTK